MGTSRTVGWAEFSEIRHFFGLKTNLLGFIVLFIVFIFVPIACLASTWPSVPFIGCSGTGETGVSAPSSRPFLVKMPERIASQLAVYAGEYQTILAPRGWNCSATGGSAEESLTIYPPLKKADEPGPEMYQITWSGDSLSGQRMMLAFGGRYFPKLFSKNQVQSFIVQSGIDETVEQFLIERNTLDRITYWGNSKLEFNSPPGSGTLGSAILAGTYRAHTVGLINISNAPDDGGITIVAIRLPPKLSYLENYIIDFSKQCLGSNPNAQCLAIPIYSVSKK